MKLPEDQQVLQGLLRETITLLCKNGLQYDQECSVEALIVVTLDQKKMFHTNIQQILGKEDLSDDEEEPTFGFYQSGHAALKRRRIQSDVSEVPSKRVVRQEGLHPGARMIPEEGGMEYEVISNYEEEEGEVNDGNTEQDSQAESPPREFSKDLRNAAEMSVEYSREGGDGQSVVALRTTDQEEVQVIQHVGMRLPTEPEVCSPDHLTPRQHAQEVTNNTETPTHTVPAYQTLKAKPRGRPPTSKSTPRVTRSHQVKVKTEDEKENGIDGSTTIESMPVVTGDGNAESGSHEEVAILQQIAQGDVKADPADQDTVEFIRQLGSEVEMSPSSVSTKTMGQPDKLRQIISSAVDKVRKEVTMSSPVATYVTTSAVPATSVVVMSAPGEAIEAKQGRGPVGQASPAAMQALVAAREDSLPRSTHGDHVMGDTPGRGRPSALPVTTNSSGTPKIAVHKPLVSVDSEDSGVLHVASAAQPIKVLHGLSGRKKHKAPRICNTCGQTFTSMQSLSDHQCGEKNLFQCGICSAMFIRKENLKKHFEEHREEVEVAVLHNQ